LYFLFNVIAGNLENKIIQLLRENSEAHFFFDEFPFGLNGLQQDELKNISDKIPEKNILWIACQYQNNPMSEDLHNCGNQLNMSFLKRSI
jgi:hypothetical protein